MRLSWGGTIGVPPIEIWSNTLRWSVIDPPPSAATLQLACNAAVNPLQGYHGSVAAGIGYAAWITWVKLNWVTVDGSQRDVSTIQTDVANGFGADDSSYVPWYQTQAITLRTATARGRAHAGRIFPPLVKHLGDRDSPYAQSAGIGLRVTAFNTMLTNLRAAMGAPIVAAGGQLPNLAVFSPGSVLKGTGAVSRLVTAIEIDRVPDVQHRRTNRVPRSIVGPSAIA